jgi:hypothetical protein
VSLRKMFRANAVTAYLLQKTQLLAPGIDAAFRPRARRAIGLPDIEGTDIEGTDWSNHHPEQSQRRATNGGYFVLQRLSLLPPNCPAFHTTGSPNSRLSALDWIQKR